MRQKKEPALPAKRKRKARALDVLEPVLERAPCLDLEAALESQRSLTLEPSSTLPAWHWWP